MKSRLDEDDCLGDSVPGIAGYDKSLTSESESKEILELVISFAAAAGPEPLWNGDGLILLTLP